jgi:hypothetical protein
LAISAETTASGSIQPGARSLVPQNDLAGNTKAFVGDFGQVLLLVVNTGKGSESAVSVPVYRPSVHCAKRMTAIEEGCGDPEDGDDVLQPLMSPPPGKKPWVDSTRWKEFRWAHPGETEVDVWHRIKLEWNSQRPRWHAFLPFWRVAIVEERYVSFLQSPDKERDSRR